jgi:hypothetical protein
MADLVWSTACLPEVNGADRDLSYSQCCSARYEFSYSANRGNGFNDSNYFPNECSASPSFTVVNIGPMIIDMEVISDDILADDELLVNGSIYEPGTEPRFLTGSENNGTGIPFVAGMSICNGQHTVAAGKLLSIVPQGSSVTLGVGDNHGIDIILSGAIILRALRAP